MDIQKIAEKISVCNHLVILTGAGMSVESGLPTFRGKEGYWVKDSKNYHPMELATYSAFRQMPETVWEWYHYRRSVYGKAKPNPGHYAIVELEHWLKKQDKSFHLVTQNVDGLHLRAGSNPDLTYQIHGNLNFMRCDVECKGLLFNIPDDAAKIPSCPECGEKCRPHVLWFDETYNEKNFKFQSSLSLINEMDCFIFVGTTLQTNLPYQMVSAAINYQIPVIEINPEPIQGLDSYKNIIQIAQKSGDVFPLIIKKLKG
ncbi:MAG: SIR2 family NAD-dependent protein deacylase [Candidatus Hodarchaeales archaeon]|jgi:NAD-dependent deacetylase